MTPLDLDGAALRALRGLCGEVLTARIAWVRNGVEVTLVREGTIVGTSRGSTLADVAINHAEVLGREDIAAPLHVARARLSASATIPAPAGDGREVSPC